MWGTRQDCVYLFSRRSIASGLPDAGIQKLNIPVFQIQNIGLLIAFLCLHCSNTAVMGGNQQLASGKLELASVDGVRPNQICSRHDKIGKVNCGASCSSVVGWGQWRQQWNICLCSWTGKSLSAELV